MSGKDDDEKNWVGSGQIIFPCLNICFWNFSTAPKIAFSHEQLKTKREVVIRNQIITRIPQVHHQQQQY